jgi:hypothetical protein
VNNAVYVDCWTGGQAAGWRPSTGPDAAPGVETWRVEYVASAARGDEVVVELQVEPEGWHARIRRADGLELVRAEGARSASPVQSRG